MKLETPDRHSGPWLGLFNDSFPPIYDGVSLAVQNYAHWLERQNHLPLLVTPWNPESVRTEYPVMRFFSLPIPNRRPYRYGYPKLDPFIWGRLRQTPFSLVHAHCPFSSGRLAVYVKKHQNVPLVATFHSKYKSDLQHSFRTTPWMVPIIMRRILNFFNACDEVWIPQREVEATVREYGYKGKLQVMENGIDYAGLSDLRAMQLREQARRQYGIPDSQLALLFVGQHILEKGVDIIIDALGLLPDGLDFRIDFIGAGYAANDMRRKASRMGLEGKVHFHGIISDREELKKRYAASDLFLFPSFYDNAPLVLREAAALGTPGILPEGSTASEVIVPGQNGFLTQRTPQAYADEITALAADRERILKAGLNARHSLVRSWEDVVGEVADRYNVILKNHR